MFYAKRLTTRTRGNGVRVFEDEPFGKERIFVVEDRAGQEKQTFFVHINRQVVHVHPMIVDGGGTGPGFQIVIKPRASPWRDFNPQRSVLGRTGR